MLFSIIIPAPKINPYLLECLNALAKESFTDYEIILVLDTDEKFIFPKTKIIACSAGPAVKRDEGAKVAKGEILAFIDDDAYPSKDWLKSALPLFAKSEISAVCGPGVTPPHDTIPQKVSGCVSESFLGTTVYNYRFLPKKQRLVDDYPSMNFLMRKIDFDKIKGFDTNYWPGEDTKLCLDIVKKLNKKILYDPNVLVYHHRRPIFLKHLQQNGRYGLHRGYFARILPDTSFRISYFIPTLFTIGVFFGWLSYFIIIQLFYLYLFIILFYLSFAVIESIKIFIRTKNIPLSFLFIPAIISTHLWYGIRFIQGYLFTNKLKR